MILNEKMKKLIEQRTGRTQEELWETDFPSLTPERDISLRNLHLVRSNIRLALGRVYTAKDMEEKQEKIIKIPPKRRYRIQAVIKRRKKGTPKIVVPED